MAPKLDTTRCSLCDARITDKYVAVIPVDKFNGIALVIGCQHKPAFDLEHAIAILASGECLVEYVDNWSSILRDLKVN